MAEEVINAKGIKKLQNKFAVLAGKLRRPRGMYKAIGVQLLNEINKNFQEQGHEGVRWTPLSPATLGRRRGGNAKILQDTGLLKGSFVSEPSNASVRVGSPVEYAPDHEFGEDGLPVRAMLPSKERALKVAVAVGQFFVNKQVRGSRLK